MNLTIDSDTTNFQLPSVFENLTLGMLLMGTDIINYTQLANMSSMDNFTDHLTMHLQKADEHISNNLNSISNVTLATSKRDPLTVLVPVSVCYAIIFIAGVLGNVITCTVISRNKSMHTATNYYLFNLAVSDLLLLLSG